MRKMGMLAGLAAVAAAALPAAAQEVGSSSVRAACAAMGLNPSEAPFAYCIRSLSQSAPPQPYAMNTPTAASDAGAYRPGFTGTGISHDPATACAAVGLDPATARYSYCVTDLRATLFDSQSIDGQ